MIDESELDELLIETGDFKLHVMRNGVAPTAEPRLTTHDSPEPAQTPAPSNGLIDVTAPMLGTFYRAEGPGAQPFVEVGAQVEPDTVVCIIEVMKMMNSVPAGVAGTVTEVLAENAELVEFGQPLFRVEPAA
ncbi:MAG: acetyl-CoA carboxylase biotin carboxyl carrier protein [Thermoleophilaceae bacterium]